MTLVKRCILAALAILLSVSLISVPALADGDEESTEEILLSSDTDGTKVSAMQESMEEEQTTVRYLNNLLEELRNETSDDITREKLTTLHNMYSSLSMAGKAKVIGYDVAEAFMESLHMTFNDETEAADTGDTGKKLGDIYKLDMDNSAISVTIYYVTDANKDGEAEQPDISIVSPSGNKTVLDPGTTTVENGDIKLTATWEEKFVQIDIAEASDGMWEIKTTNTCAFNSFDYAGSGKDEPFSEAEIDETETSSADKKEKPEGTESNALTKVIVWFVGSVVVIIAIFVLVKKLLFVKTDDEDKRAKNRSRNRKRSDEDDDEESYHSNKEEDEEEVMRKMADFLKSQEVSSEYDDEEAVVKNGDASIRIAFDDVDNESSQFEEYTEYPSGTYETEDDDDDDDFGNRV